MNETALTRIQSSLRTAASRSRETARFGPFLATLTPHSASPFLNYGIPDADAEPTPDEIAALVTFYEARDRKPRLEYVPHLAPKVEAALLEAGFAIENRAPLMVLDALRSVPFPDGVELGEPRSLDEVRRLLSVLNEAFGDEPPSDVDVERQRKRLEAGTIALLATFEGESAGGGLIVPDGEGLAEVAGIGVREPLRRRGIAATVVFRLTELALARDVDTPFLMAASEREARLYARVGYETIGEMRFVRK